MDRQTHVGKTSREINSGHTLDRQTHVGKTSREINSGHTLDRQTPVGKTSREINSGHTLDRQTHVGKTSREINSGPTLDRQTHVGKTSREINIDEGQRGIGECQWQIQGGGTCGAPPPPISPNPNLLTFWYALVKDKLAYAFNTINLLSIFTINLLL